MAVELTEEEMVIERRAEEIEKELFQSEGEFMEWLQEEFSVTAKARQVHQKLMEGTGAVAGTILQDMYTDYCMAKAYEMARDER